MEKAVFSAISLELADSLAINTHYRVGTGKQLAVNGERLAVEITPLKA